MKREGKVDCNAASKRLHIGIKLRFSVSGTEPLALEGAETDEAFCRLFAEAKFLAERFHKSCLLCLLFKAVHQSFVTLLPLFDGVNGHS
jgi:hypothetical protein